MAIEFPLSGGIGKKFRATVVASISHTHKTQPESIPLPTIPSTSAVNSAGINYFSSVRSISYSSVWCVPTSVPVERADECVGLSPSDHPAPSAFRYALASAASHAHEVSLSLSFPHPPLSHPLSQTHEYTKG